MRRSIIAAVAASSLFVGMGRASAEVIWMTDALGVLAEQVRLLFARVDDLRDGPDEVAATAPLAIGRLGLQVGSHALPLPALDRFVPPGLKEQRPLRAGAHMSGSARLPSNRQEAGQLGIVSPGLALGADLRLDGARSLGAAMGYAGSAGLEASTAALYALHDGRFGSLGILAGAGNAHFPGPGRTVSRADLAFGAADLRAHMQPLAGFTFEPSARIGIRHVGAAGEADAVYRMDAALNLDMAYRIENAWGRIRPSFSVGVRRQFDAGPSRSRTALHRQSPVLEPDMDWRFGVSATPWTGPTFSLDHEAQDVLEGGGSSTVTARMRMRF